MEQTDLTVVADTVAKAVEEVLSYPVLGAGGILVVGCSTSEIKGHGIGSASDIELASVIFDVLGEAAVSTGFDLAIQCCEHLNRALVIERAVARGRGLDPVSVIPTPEAGGALATVALVGMTGAVVVERIAADAGIDIGHTLIGMHLRPVAVPLRLGVTRVGRACLVAAGSRPRLIGGARAQYPADRWGGGVDSGDGR